MRRCTLTGINLLGLLGRETGTSGCVRGGWVQVGLGRVGLCKDRCTSAIKYRRFERSG